VLPLSLLGFSSLFFFSETNHSGHGKMVYKMVENEIKVTFTTYTKKIP
jgi:hypothetical protein